MLTLVEETCEQTHIQNVANCAGRGRGGGMLTWHVESPASMLATKARGLWLVGVKM